MADVEAGKRLLDELVGLAFLAKNNCSREEIVLRSYPLWGRVAKVVQTQWQHVIHVTFGLTFFRLVQRNGRWRRFIPQALAGRNGPHAHPRAGTPFDDCACVL